MGAKFEQLEVWKNALSLAKAVELIVTHLIEKRKYPIADQISRSSISVLSNIAEGCESGTDRNYLRYLKIASGSLSEVRAQLIFLRETGYITSEEQGKVDELASTIYFQLYGLKRYLRSQV